MSPYQTIDEQIEHSARRLEMAFMVRLIADERGSNWYEGNTENGVQICCFLLCYPAGFVSRVEVGNEAEFCLFTPSLWGTTPNLSPAKQNSYYNDLMRRGLYRLGCDDDILSQLPPLNAHERLELRLSLPREFWPQTWLDEEMVSA